MKRLPMVIGLLLAPAGGWAQGFTMDFDPEPDPAYADAARQPTPPAADTAPAGARTGSVRYAQRSVPIVAATSPRADLDRTRLPTAHR